MAYTVAARPLRKCGFTVPAAVRSGGRLSRHGALPLRPEARGCPLTICLGSYWLYSSPATKYPALLGYFTPMFTLSSPVFLLPFRRLFCRQGPGRRLSAPAIRVPPCGPPVRNPTTLTTSGAGIATDAVPAGLEDAPPPFSGSRCRSRTAPAPPPRNTPGSISSGRCPWCRSPTSSPAAPVSAPGSPRDGPRPTHPYQKYRRMGRPPRCQCHSPPPAPVPASGAAPGSPPGCRARRQ